MKYCLITKTYDGIGLLLRLKQAGNQVSIVSLDDYYLDVFKSVAPVITLAEARKDAETILIFDHLTSEDLNKLMVEKVVDNQVVNKTYPMDKADWLELGRFITGNTGD